MKQRILVLGDVHANIPRVAQVCRSIQWQPEDVLLLVGDLGLDISPLAKTTPLDQVRSVVELLDEIELHLPLDHIAWIPGNHDHPIALRHLPGCIDGSLKTFPSGLRVAGVGGAVGSFGFPYEPTEQAMEKALLNVGLADVLLCHQPPAAMGLSRCTRGYDGGSLSIRSFLEEGFLGRLMVCGHIHEACGAEMLDMADGKSVLCVNAGSFGRPYPAMRYVEIVFDLDSLDLPIANIVEVKK